VIEGWRNIFLCDLQFLPGLRDSSSTNTTPTTIKNTTTLNNKIVFFMFMRSLCRLSHLSRPIRTYPSNPIPSLPSRSLLSPPPARQFPRRFYSQKQAPHPNSESASKENGPKNESDNQESKKEENPKDDPPDPPPDPNKSPLQVFIDTFKSELSKSRELQETVRALQDESGKIGDSEALRRAKEAYAKAKEQSDKASNLTGKVIKRAASTVGKAASATWDSDVVKSGRKVVSDTASTVARGVTTATEPIRQNEIYKTVSGAVGEAMDDGSFSRYGGYRSREERRRLRAEWEKKQKNRRVEANPDAGENVVLHKDSAWKEQWDKFREENSAYQSLMGFKRRMYDENENMIVSGVRNTTDWIKDTWSGMFAETETAQVVRRFKEMDPNFNMDYFHAELREWIIPEIVDAYVKADVETLSQWFSEAVRMWLLICY